MATENKTPAVEAEITDAAEELTEAEAAETAEEKLTEAEVTETAGEELAEAEVAETAGEELAEADASADQPVKVSSKRIKKTQRREAKAARKAANKIEEKKSRPNNALIALLIFGVLVGMFAFVLGYNYFSKPATIAKYLEKNGGEEAFGAMPVDEYTVAAITADGNSMNLELTALVDDETLATQIREFYGGDNGKKQLDYLAAYFLTSIKPQTRAFSADVKASFKLNDEELNTTELTFKEAEKVMNPDEEESGSADEDSAAEDTSDDAEEDAGEASAGDTGDAAEEATEDAGDAAAESESGN